MNTVNKILKFNMHAIHPYGNFEGAESFHYVVPEKQFNEYMDAYRNGTTLLMVDGAQICTIVSGHDEGDRVGGGIYYYSAEFEEAEVMTNKCMMSTPSYNYLNFMVSGDEVGCVHPGKAGTCFAMRAPNNSNDWINNFISGTSTDDDGTTYVFTGKFVPKPSELKLMNYPELASAFGAGKTKVFCMDINDKTHLVYKNTDDTYIAKYPTGTYNDSGRVWKAAAALKYIPDVTDSSLGFTVNQNVVNMFGKSGWAVQFIVEAS